MGASAPKVADTPPEPETVKRVESEVVQARNAAKTAAAKRSGAAATNVTQGKVTDETAQVKKSKLGGV